MPGGWVARKLDSLGGAVVAAGGGIAASQWPAFLDQYIQRLGGHLDEATRNVTHLTTLRDLAEPAQANVIVEILTEAERRSQALAESLRQLTEAGVALKPVVFLREMDPTIARATLESFTPALPLDTGALVWGGLGMVLALTLYELTKGVGMGLGRAAARLTGGAARRSSRTPPMVNRVEPRL
jgi:hypothetical protein